jgi:hypothetical protein
VLAQRLGALAAELPQRRGLQRAAALLVQPRLVPLRVARLRRQDDCW